MKPRILSFSVMWIVVACFNCSAQDKSVKDYVGELDKLTDEQVLGKAEQLSREIRLLLRYRPQYEQHKNRRVVLRGLQQKLQKQLKSTQDSLKGYRETVERQIKEIQQSEEADVDIRLALLVEDYQGPMQALMNREKSLNAQIKELDGRIKACESEERAVQDRLVAAEAIVTVPTPMLLPPQVKSSWSAKEQKWPTSRPANRKPRSVKSSLERFRELGVGLNRKEKEQ